MNYNIIGKGCCKINDYKFGNEICKMRNALHLSQTQLAEKIGVSNKAISKWENGVSKPTTNALRRLAYFFDIPVEQMLSLREKESEPKRLKKRRNWMTS